MELVSKFKRTIYLSVFLISVLSINVFAKSGLEVVGFGSIELGKGKQAKNLFLNSELNAIDEKTTLKGRSGLEGLLIAQIGYMFQVNDIQGISILGELGYSRDVFSFQHLKTDPGYKFSFSSDSFLTGAAIKYNLDFVSFGVAGGVKVPASGVFSAEILDKQNNIVSGADALQYTQIQEMFGISIIPYIRFNVDFSIFFSDTLAMIVGIYSGFDIGPNVLKYDNVFDYSSYAEYNILNAMDAGVTLGIKFGHEIVPKDRTPPPVPEDQTNTMGTNTINTNTLTTASNMNNSSYYNSRGYF